MNTDRFHSLTPITSLSYDLDVLIGFEHFTQHLARQWFIIHYEHTDEGRLSHFVYLERRRFFGGVGEFLLLLHHRAAFSGKKLEYSSLTGRLILIF